MKKTFKIMLSTLLALVLLISVGTVAFAEDENVNITEDNLSVMSANVAGLPIPSKFDKDGKVVPKTQKILGQLLNTSGVDIICVQEDFQYHSILAAQMKNYPYTTYTSGGVPVGDGMNIYSKYPIYNVERVAWEVFNGILDAANDGLTPKGFLKCTVDFNGVLVDVYDTHLDANGSLADCAAKKAQLEQLRITKTAREAQAEAIGAFMFEVQELDTITDFDEKLWLTIIDTVTVHTDGRMTFEFQGGKTLTSY